MRHACRAKGQVRITWTWTTGENRTWNRQIRKRVLGTELVQLLNDKLQILMRWAIHILINTLCVMLKTGTPRSYRPGEILHYKTKHDKRLGLFVWLAVGFQLKLAIHIASASACVDVGMKLQYCVGSSTLYFPTPQFVSVEVNSSVTLRSHDTLSHDDLCCC